MSHDRDSQHRFTYSYFCNLLGFRENEQYFNFKEAHALCVHYQKTGYISYESLSRLTKSLSIPTKNHNYNFTPVKQWLNVFLKSSLNNSVFLKEMQDIHKSSDSEYSKLPEVWYEEEEYEDEWLEYYSRSPKNYKEDFHFLIDHVDQREFGDGYECIQYTFVELLILSIASPSIFEITTTGWSDKKYVEKSWDEIKDEKMLSSYKSKEEEFYGLTPLFEGDQPLLAFVDSLVKKPDPKISSKDQILNHIKTLSPWMQKYLLNPEKHFSHDPIDFDMLGERLLENQILFLKGFPVETPEVEISENIRKSGYEEGSHKQNEYFEVKEYEWENFNSISLRAAAIKRNNENQTIKTNTKMYVVPLNNARKKVLDKYPDFEFVDTIKKDTLKNSEECKRQFDTLIAKVHMLERIMDRRKKPVNNTLKLNPPSPLTPQKETPPKTRSLPPQP